MRYVLGGASEQLEQMWVWKRDAMRYTYLQNLSMNAFMYLHIFYCIYTIFTESAGFRNYISMSSRSAGGSSFDPNSFWVKLYWPLSGGEQASWARDYDHYRSMDQFGTGQTRLRSKKTHRFVVYLEILKSCVQPGGSRMTWSVPPLVEPASWYGRCLQLWQVVEDIGLVVTPGDGALLKFHACLWFTWERMALGCRQY